jgi:hypothetical protein
MCLPSVVLAVLAVAAGEESVLGVYHLIILLKVHSPNLRHNNIEHREIVGSSPTFFFTADGGLPFLFFFLRVRGFFFLSAAYAHDRGVLTRSTTFVSPFFSFPRGVLFVFWFDDFVSHRSVASHFFF